MDPFSTRVRPDGGNTKASKMRIISVIIASHNRYSDLEEVLNGLMLQEINGNFLFEVLVVDNHSTDTTKESVFSYVPKFSSEDMKKKCLGLRYIFESIQGKSYALNHGVKEAKGDILVFTDDDVWIDKQWLKNVVSCFDEFQCDGVGGRVVPIYPDQTPQWVKDHPVQLAGVVVIADYGEETKPYGRPMDPFIGSNYAFKREVFKDCGFFREDLGPGAPAMGEDSEFVMRLAEKGKLLYYCGGAVIRHPVDLSRLRLKYISKWHIALGRFAARLEMDHKKSVFVYYFGVPRYLIAGVMKDAFFLLIYVFSRIRFYNRLRGFFRKVGMIMEYRDTIQKKVA